MAHRRMLTLVYLSVGLLAACHSAPGAEVEQPADVEPHEASYGALDGFLESAGSDRFLAMVPNHTAAAADWARRSRIKVGRSFAPRGEMRADVATWTVMLLHDGVPAALQTVDEPRVTALEFKVLPGHYQVVELFGSARASGYAPDPITELDVDVGETATVDPRPTGATGRPAPVHTIRVENEVADRKRVKRSWLWQLHAGHANQRLDMLLSGVVAAVEFELPAEQDSAQIRVRMMDARDTVLPSAVEMTPCEAQVDASAVVRVGSDDGRLECNLARG